MKLSLRAEDPFWISFDPGKIQSESVIDFHQRLPTAESHSVAKLFRKLLSLGSDIPFIGRPHDPGICMCRVRCT